MHWPAASHTRKASVTCKSDEHLACHNPYRSPFEDGFACESAGRTRPPGRSPCPRNWRVDVGIGSRQRRPHAGPARMDEAEPRKSASGRYVLKTVSRPIRRHPSAVVRNDHVHIMAPARQRPSEQRFGTASPPMVCRLYSGARTGRLWNPTKRFSSPKIVASLKDGKCRDTPCPDPFAHKVILRRMVLVELIHDLYVEPADADRLPGLSRDLWGWQKFAAENRRKDPGRLGRGVVDH